MVALYILVVLLSVATAILFAMLGQLAARLPEFQGPQAGRILRLEELEHGRPVPSWAALPAAESSPNGNGRPLQGLLVLSTICATCEELAKELADQTLDTLPLPLRVVLSTPLSPADAREYVQRHGLDAYRPFVDERGDRCRDDLGVTVSPALVLVRDGRILEGYTLNRLSDIDTVLSLLAARDTGPTASDPQEVQAHEH